MINLDMHLKVINKETNQVNHFSSRHIVCIEDNGNEYVVITTAGVMYFDKESHAFENTNIL